MSKFIKLKKNKIKSSELFLYSVKIGLSAFLRSIVTQESIKRIICPLDVSRYYELPVVGNSLNVKLGTKILDISSPKLLTYFLADTNPQAKFYAIDKFKEELNSWKKIKLTPKNMILEYADATKLKYPSNYFDEIYSVSVIEHLGNGDDKSDSTMMKECYRVLKKGGRLYLTTLVSCDANKIYKNSKYYSKGNLKSEKFFFCRIYDYLQIKDRLLSAAKFKIDCEEVCNYKYPIYEQVFNTFMPFSVLMGWLNLLVAPKTISTSRKMTNIKKRAEYFCILKK